MSSSPHGLRSANRMIREFVRAPGYSRKLLLTNCSLYDYPERLFSCDRIFALFLQRNEFKTFHQICTSQFVSLKELCINMNRLTCIPPQIKELKNLTKLSLNNNKIKQIAPELCELVNLEVLQLKSNLITHLPSNLGKCSKLSQLNVANNDLQYLPRSLRTCRFLKGTKSGGAPCLDVRQNDKLCPVSLSMLISGIDVVLTTLTSSGIYERPSSLTLSEDRNSPSLPSLENSTTTSTSDTHDTNDTNDTNSPDNLSPLIRRRNLGVTVHVNDRNRLPDLDIPDPPLFTRSPPNRGPRRNRAQLLAGIVQRRRRSVSASSRSGNSSNNSSPSSFTRPSLSNSQPILKFSVPELDSKPPDYHFISDPELDISFSASLVLHPPTYVSFFQCPICLQIPSRPQLTSVCCFQCQSMFCRSCVSSWLNQRMSCPVCRVSLSNSTLKQPALFISTVLDSLELKCPFGPFDENETPQTPLKSDSLSQSSSISTNSPLPSPSMSLVPSKSPGVQTPVISTPNSSTDESSPNPPRSPSPISHQIKSLPKCPWQGSIIDLEGHIKVCKYRPGSCSGCSENLILPLFQTHLLTCPASYILCPSGCKKYVRRALVEDVHFKKCPQAIISCTLCSEGIKRCETVVHEQFWCPNAIIPCLNKKYGCNEQIARKDMENHTLSNCQFIPFECTQTDCKVLISKKQLGEHLKVCDYLVVECKNTGCSQSMIRQSMKVHENQTCEFRTVSCTFPLCKHQTIGKDLDAHLLECEFRYVSCPNHGCEVMVQSCFLENHKLDDCPIQVIQCPNNGCDEKFQRLNLENHMKECAHLQVVCHNKHLGCPVVYSAKQGHNCPYDQIQSLVNHIQNLSKGFSVIIETTKEYDMKRKLRNFVKSLDSSYVSNEDDSKS